MVAFFVRIYRWLDGHRSVCYSLLAVIVGACLMLLPQLRLSEDIAHFLPTDKHNQQINFAYQHIGGANKIVINIKGLSHVDDATLMDAADTLASLLQNGDAAAHFHHLQHKIDQEKILEISSFLTNNMVYFLDSAHYVRMDSLMQPHVLEKQLAVTKAQLLSPMGMVFRDWYLSDPLLFGAPLLQQLQGFQFSDRYLLKDDYLFDKEDSTLVVTLDANYPGSETAKTRLLVEAVNTACAQTQDAFHGSVQVEPFGSSYIALTNASQIKKDSILSISLAIFLILALLIAYFRNSRSVLLIAAAITFGALVALAITGVLRSSLSLIAIGAGSIIVGIAANYPLHFLSHIHEGYSPEDSLKDIVSPLTTGNITTVAAFLSLLLISSSAMRDLGIFASLLLLATIAFVLVFMPHFSRPIRHLHALRFGRLASGNPERNKWIVGALVLVTIFFLCIPHKATFDANLQSINYMTKQQKAQFGKMLEQTQGSRHLMYYVAPGQTIDQALEHYEQGAAAASHLKTSGIGGFVPSKAMQRKRLEQWNDFWSTRREPFLEHLEQAAQEAGFKSGSFETCRRLLYKEYLPQEIDFFEPILQDIAGNYLYRGEEQSLVYTFVHTTSQEALQIEEQLNQEGNPIGCFAFDSTTLTRKMVDLLSNDFDSVLFLCALVVFVFLTLSFGRFELSMITFLPLATAWIWILGIMSLLGIRFNIVNIILATFIFGMGDDYTIFMTEGMMYEFAYKRKMLSTYKNTVALSALIMLIGIGSLIIARHPAMHSLAQVTIIGMVSVVLMAYVIPPFFFRWLTTKKGKDRCYPLTLKNLLATAYAFAFFLLATFFLSLYGFFLLTIGGKSEKHRLQYHNMLQQICRFVVKRIPYASLHLHNYQEETFAKPSIIIANHQAHIDLMAIMALTPKMIIITNQWVWHFPFYGLIIRYADFCPIDDLMNQDLSFLKSRVEAGYSIMFFPEGSRSADCSIKRFHRGAFYLAQQWHLPIVPVLLHGFGHVLPKEDFLLHKGRLTVRILPTIAPEDEAFGTDFAQRARQIRQYYQQKFKELQQEVETPDYFVDAVLHRYIYKGAPIERRVRKGLRNLAPAQELYRRAMQETASPTEALPLTFRMENASLGEQALLAALACPSQLFQAVIPDEDDRELAQNAAALPNNIIFVSH